MRERYNPGRAEVAARLRAHRAERTRSDLDLNPELAAWFQGRPPPRPAAVLVPLVARRAGLHVVLTRRTKALSHHAGQIAFPGGKQDPQDADSAATALREAQEEIGLAPGDVELAGLLSTYLTGTGFRIAPHVGFVEPRFRPRPDPAEVEDVFEVPLAFILDPANRVRKSAVWNGVRRHFFAFPYQGRDIWGATAGMLVNLAEILHD